MVWGAFSVNGVLELQVVSSKMKSSDYTNVLQCSLLPFLNQNFEKNYIFQQDNASIHSIRETKQWLESNNIPVLEWPACSPDINPIENIWGILTRRVFAEYRQYNSVPELKTAIFDAWEGIEENTIKNLVTSTENRIFECIKNNGGVTHY